MQKIFSNKIFWIVLGVVLVIVSFSSGVYLGFLNRPEVARITSLTHTDLASAPTQKVDFDPFWKVWNTLNDKFVAVSTTSDAQIGDQKRVWGAIAGLTASLNDPYTVFFPPEESKSFATEISGSFSGVGMEVGVRDNHLVVVAPLKNSPAQKAGIRTGDQILKIDGQATDGLAVDKAVKLIRGKDGTTVTITVLREGKKDPMDITITRAPIEIPTIDTQEKDGVFIIRLYNFSAIASNLFRDALREFVVTNKDKLILDVRGNPGGYLDAAVDMASWFLAPGKLIVTEDFGKKSDPIVYKSKGYNVFGDKLKMAVLINGGSASASEILAGALKENGIATLIGEKSFGKGSVQELVKITPETSLKVTVARWLTPLGNSISHAGINPDIVVKFTQDDATKGKDPQLERAIKFLNTGK
ncbi:MAG: carboxy-terminal-processing protease, carboxyl-terminal processing protease [Candidatus Parcubacteria bacterium]|jgi:carboxyl-terminal processing protease